MKLFKTSILLASLVLMTSLGVQAENTPSNNAQPFCSGKILSGVGGGSSDSQAGKVARGFWRANVIKEYGLSLNAAKHILWSLSVDQKYSCSSFKIPVIGKRAHSCTVKARPCAVTNIF